MFIGRERTTDSGTCSQIPHSKRLPNSISSAGGNLELFTLAIANQKGGIGKTTTATALSYALAQAGKTVLLVDMDPQASTTGTIMGPDFEPDKHVYDVMTDPEQIGHAIYESPYPNLYMLPSTILLSAAELTLQAQMGRESKLRFVLENLSETGLNPDLILIDTPPSLGVLTVNSLVAADSILIPMEPDAYSLRGIEQLLDTVNMIRRNRLNTTLDVLGVLVTNVDARRTITEELIQEIKDFFGPGLVLPLTIRQDAQVAYAARAGQPIGHYNPKSTAAQSYAELAQEVITRVQARANEVA